MKGAHVKAIPGHLYVHTVRPCYLFFIGNWRTFTFILTFRFFGFGCPAHPVFQILESIILQLSWISCHVEAVSPLFRRSHQASEDHIRHSEDHTGPSECCTGRSEGRTGHSEGRTGHSEGRTGHSESRTGRSEDRTGHSEDRTGHSEGRTGHSFGKSGEK